MHPQESPNVDVEHQHIPLRALDSVSSFFFFLLFFSPLFILFWHHPMARNKADATFSVS